MTWGGPEENDILQENFLRPTRPADKISPHTRHRAVIFRRPLFENTIDKRCRTSGNIFWKEIFRRPLWAFKFFSMPTLDTSKYFRTPPHSFLQAPLAINNDRSLSLLQQIYPSTDSEMLLKQYWKSAEGLNFHSAETAHTHTVPLAEFRHLAWAYQIICHA